jgi:hypothetical protein
LVRHKNENLFHTNYETEFNSNSLTHGLANANNLLLPTIHYDSYGATPGWNKPVDGFYFETPSPLLPSTGSSSLFGPSAAGGFVLYPSKPNTNMMQYVYRK